MVRQSRPRCAVTVDDGRWKTLKKPLASGRNWSPSLLLGKGERLLRGNARFALTRGGPVVLSERRCVEQGLEPVDLDDAISTRHKQFTAEIDRPPSPDEIEAILAACTATWASRDGGWVVPADAGSPELSVRKTSTGVRVDAVLATWEGDLGAPQREAMAHFLCVVHAAIRFARCRLESGSAHVASQAAAARLDEELPDSLAAVAHVHRFLARDVQALRHAAIADAYLNSVAARYDRLEN
jgi:hypothetical protein